MIVRINQFTIYEIGIRTINKFIVVIFKGLLTRRVTTTAHRKELISDLVGNLPAKGMSIKSATEAIEMIDAVAERSHSYTIASPFLPFRAKCM